jgi:threonine dehydrogenase-like Zn-dependent dehydrogenase
VVGLLAAALLARIPGLDPVVCDLDPGRAALVETLGARFCRPDDAPEARDLIIHASADPAGLRLALSRAGFEGRIIEASWYGDREAALPLGEDFHARRLSILSSQVGQVAPAMRGRRSHAERLALALALLEDARLDALLGPPVRFEDLPEALPALLGAGAPPCPVVTYI